MSKQHLCIGIFNGEALCFPWGRNWILKYYLNEYFRISKCYCMHLMATPSLPPPRLKLIKIKSLALEVSKLSFHIMQFTIKQTIKVWGPSLKTLLLAPLDVFIFTLQLRDVDACEFSNTDHLSLPKIKSLSLLPRYFLFSTVGVAMDYVLDGRYSISDSGKRFFSTPQRPDRQWGPHSPLSNGYWGLIPPVVKMPGRGADHSPPYCWGQEWWSYTFTPSCVFMAWCLLNYRATLIITCSTTFLSYLSPLFTLRTVNGWRGTNEKVIQLSYMKMY
jgi:hypothetical protein